MFSTLNVNSLEVVHSVSTHNKQSPAYGFKPGGTSHKKSRSKKGCLCCRKRKKKCDETYPVCKGCQQRRVECLWPQIRKELVEKPVGTPAETQVPILPSEDVENLDLGLFDLDEVNVNYFSLSPLPLSVFQLYLSEDGLRFIEHYKIIFSSDLSLGVNDSHYFINTFLKHAQNNEAIMYMVASLGGLLMECISKSDNTRSLDVIQNRDLKLSYLQKAANAILEKHPDPVRAKSKDEFFTLFCYYLLLISFHICSGDVLQWHQYLVKLQQLVENYGGLYKALDDFGYSNDIKWLISDLQFHDVVSSRSLTDGTLYPIDTYTAITSSYIGYGIDPFQSVATPVFLIWGKINNHKVEMTKRIQEIAACTDEHESRALRIDYFARIDTVCSEILQELDTCMPNVENAELLLLNSEVMETHMIFFELLVLICKIHLNASIKRFTPHNYQQQSLLLQCFDRIDILNSSQMFTALPIAIVVCGSVCVTATDRQFMKDLIQKGSSRYKLGNHKRISEVVEETWIRNPHGKENIMWDDIVDERGWNLSIG